MDSEYRQHDATPRPTSGGEPALSLSSRPDARPPQRVREGGPRHWRELAAAAFDLALEGRPGQAQAWAQRALASIEQTLQQREAATTPDQAILLAKVQLLGALVMAELQAPGSGTNTAGLAACLEDFEAVAIALTVLRPIQTGEQLSAANQQCIARSGLALEKLFYAQQTTELPRCTRFLESLLGCYLPQEPLHFRRAPKAQLEHWAYWDFEIAKMMIARQGQLSDYLEAHAQRLHFLCRLEVPSPALERCWEREERAFCRGLQLLETPKPCAAAITPKRGSRGEA